MSAILISVDDFGLHSTSEIHLLFYKVRTRAPSERSI